MSEEPVLQGRSIIVAGAGLAGLAAAVDLHDAGARVTVVEARDRVGGRVWTLRDGWFNGQHAEAGGDLIDHDQEEMHRLATRLGLDLVPILDGGFGFVRRGDGGGSLVQSGPSAGGWHLLRERLDPWIRDYRLADRRWDSLVARDIARLSVADWLEQVKADEEARARVRGLRGFFLADAADLSLLALVEELATEVPGRGLMYRIRGGNDQLTSRLAAMLPDRVQLQTEVVAVAQTTDRVLVRLRAADGTESDMAADYMICAVPAATLRNMVCEPPLPPEQRDAIVRLPYGRATRTLLQFARGFWRRPGRPRAFGTDLAIGAVWDGNEEQSGEEAILSLLAGGSASIETQRMLAAAGIDAVSAELTWLGRGDIMPVLTSRVVSWEDDRWAGGGYAYFNPMYDPAWRLWLCKPHGRMLFAGEHTSLQWQGYMNGAVESGLRAAREVRSLVRQSRRRMSLESGKVMEMGS